jgi:hypothetical protein
MKTIIAIVGFTAACIGASEYCRAEQIEHGVVSQFPQSVPLSVLDQLQPIMAMDDAPNDYVPLVSGMWHIGMTEGVITNSRIALLASSRCPRDCLRQFQCPIDREPDSQ